MIFIHPEVGFLAIKAYVGRPRHLALKADGTLGVSVLTALNIDINYHMVASRANHQLQHQQWKQFVLNVEMKNKNGEQIEGRWHSAYARNICGHHAIVDSACGCRTMAMVENMTLK